MVDSIKEALQEACVAVYKELQDHVAWTGEHIRDAGKHRHQKKGNNSSGDKVLAIDLVADAAFQKGFASEEQEDFIPSNPDGNFIVVYDPLDGSNNIPVGLSVGAIFGIFPGKSLDDVKSGEDMVADRGYDTEKVRCSVDVACGSGYDFEHKEWQTFIESHKMPRKGKTYCINEGNCAKWDSFIATFVAQNLRGRSVRWMCCMVADVHRPLLQGGCFMYPCDTSFPKGRLRLLYEAYPMAFIWEKAGGSAFVNNDAERIRSLPLSRDDIHARCGIIFLGPEETRKFYRLRDHLPVAFGGSENARTKRLEKKVDGKVRQEMKFLRIALAVGAIVQCALLYKWYRAETKTRVEE